MVLQDCIWTSLYFSSSFKSFFAFGTNDFTSHSTDYCDWGSCKLRKIVPGRLLIWIYFRYGIFCSSRQCCHRRLWTAFNVICNPTCIPEQTIEQSADKINAPIDKTKAGWLVGWWLIKKKKKKDLTSEGNSITAFAVHHPAIMLPDCIYGLCCWHDTALLTYINVIEDEKSETNTLISCLPRAVKHQH